jgi:hypothetical protein
MPPTLVWKNYTLYDEYYYLMDDGRPSERNELLSDAVARGVEVRSSQRKIAAGHFPTHQHGRCCQYLHLPSWVIGEKLQNSKGTLGHGPCIRAHASEKFIWSAVSGTSCVIPKAVGNLVSAEHLSLLRVPQFAIFILGSVAHPGRRLGPRRAPEAVYICTPLSFNL